MPRKKKVKRCFDESEKLKRQEYNVGHSWFCQSENDSDNDSCSESDLEFLSSTSGRKLTQIMIDDDVSSFAGRRIFDLCVLELALGSAAVCAVCKQGSLSIEETQATGWSTNINFLCSNLECVKNSVSNTEKGFCTSTMQGQQYDINKACVLAMRAIGRGHSAATKFSAVMGLPKPVSKPTFAKYTKDWNERCIDQSEEVLEAAGEEVWGMIRGEDKEGDDEEEGEDEVLDCKVSIDGSWLTRGRHSKHGFVSVISDISGKVLDRIYKCSICRQCSQWKNKDHEGIEYLEWYVKHEPDCTLTHEGSSQAMESSGAVQLFGRSIRKHQLRYQTFIGDGDSKSYDNVVKSAPYGPTFLIQKEECTGHVQKRMGTRLRSLVAKYKGKYYIS